MRREARVAESDAGVVEDTPNRREVCSAEDAAERLRSGGGVLNSARHNGAVPSRSSARQGEPGRARWQEAYRDVKPSRIQAALALPTEHAADAELTIVAAARGAADEIGARAGGGARRDLPDQTPMRF